MLSTGIANASVLQMQSLGIHHRACCNPGGSSAEERQGGFLAHSCKLLERFCLPTPSAPKISKVTPLGLAVSLQPVSRQRTTESISRDTRSIMFCCWGLHWTGSELEGGSRGWLGAACPCFFPVFRWHDDFTFCSAFCRRSESESLLWSFTTVTWSALKQLRRSIIFGKEPGRAPLELKLAPSCGGSHSILKVSFTTERTCSIKTPCAFRAERQRLSCIAAHSWRVRPAAVHLYAAIFFLLLSHLQTSRLLVYAVAAC